MNINNSCKFLGVLIDNRLSFKNHVKYVTDRISRNSSIFYEIHDKLPFKARLNCYYGFIYPYLTYNIFWGCPSLVLSYDDGRGRPPNLKKDRIARVALYT